MFCGLSASQLCGGANGYLLQEGLCHMLHDSGLLQPELLSPWQATADPCLHRRHLNTQRQVWLSLCGVSGSWWAQGFVQALQASLEGKLGLILNVILPLQPYCWDFLFALEHGASFFFWWNPTFSCRWLFSSELQFWSSHRIRWVHILLLCHLQNCSGGYKMVQLFWKTVGFFLQNYHMLTIQSSNCTHWYLLKRIENLCPHENLHIDVHISHNCPNLETTNISFGVWMDK